MRTRGPGRGATGAAWGVVAAALLLALVAAIEPDLRPVTITVSGWATAALVLTGVHRWRPASAGPWLAVALMVGLWAAGTTLAQVQGRSTLAATVLVGAGQATAVAVTAHLVRAARAPRRSGAPYGVDVLVIATTLGLVGAQLVAVASSGGGSSLSAVVVPTVDVLIVGLLLRLLVSRRHLGVSAHLALAAALATVVYDLVAALDGNRIVPSGHPGQVLGTVSGLLFAAAALHPTMGAVFDREEVSRPRRPSASLLGLLPLVVVPLAVWWVADLRDAPGLPTPVFLVAGAVVAGLGVLRGAGALRASEHLAEHDPLTDLANRRGLARAYEERCAQGGLSLVLIDVDEFKAVNDSHGHDVGDALLVEVGERLRAAAGGAGCVARLGGDEFVLLIDADRAGEVAAAVMGTLRRPVHVGGLVLSASASVGVASPDDGPALPELLTRADVAMYAAKAAGRDTCVVYEPRMRAEVARRFTLGNEVRQLLCSADPAVGHLEVHYQPLVELVSGAPVGGEALVRWRHPVHGLMAPDAFLDLVTARGLDAQLDLAVLHQVVDQLARWQDQGREPLPVSVNLTCASLLDPALAEGVLRALADAAVPAALLHVEITEHDELPEESSAAGSLHALGAAGVGVKLDDYGTGYTSLDYLRRFPVQELKLDRSVVSGATAADDQLVAGIAAMAATMRLDVLAEGVETPQQRDRLVALGVRYGQGWLFARPLPAAEYAQRVLGADGVRPPHLGSGGTVDQRSRVGVGG